MTGKTSNFQGLRWLATIWFGLPWTFEALGSTSTRADNATPSQ